MKTIKNILLCAPFFGLFAVALPGCPNEPEEQPPVETAPLEVICGKAAECGELGEGKTVEQCAAELAPAFDALKQDDVCGPMIERLESFTACAMQHSTCEELDSDDEMTEAHPCFEERERVQQAVDEANKKKPGASSGCSLAAGFAMAAAASPPSDSDSECTTADECPTVQCPGATGTASGCLNGYCMTEEDMCE
ncbi:hypothetical protein WME99_23200 [Sorangium sp. So ce136]|uniref:hypothetical protein n=1 Tax=Sorangium sp. So ce136 TaxID=3133284 RepID=UPI003F023EEA